LPGAPGAEKEILNAFSCLELSEIIVDSVSRAIGEKAEIHLLDSEKRRLLERAKKVVTQSDFRISIPSPMGKPTRFLD
jgi:hypothetical protein